MTDDIRQEFAAAGQIRAQQIRDERKRRENPKRTTSENGQKFAEHLEAILAQHDITNL